MSLGDIYGEVKGRKMMTVERYDMNGNGAQLSGYEDIGGMILDMIDDVNGIEFTKRADDILNEREAEAYFEHE